MHGTADRPYPSLRLSGCAALLGSAACLLLACGQPLSPDDEGALPGSSPGVTFSPSSIWAPGTIPSGPPSPVPTLAEWTAAHTVDVTKATAYHCETKVVREWFRSVCVAYDRWTLLQPICKQSNGDACMALHDQSGKGAQASIIQRLRRGHVYVLRFVWNPGAVGYDLTITVDNAGGAVAGF